MSCERMAELISIQLDGALTDQEAVQLNEHLERCPACRALEAQLTALHEALDDMEELKAPEGFAEGVMKQIRASEADKSKVIPLLRRPQVRALAGLAACAVLCVGLYQGGQANVELTQSASSAAGQEMEMYAATTPAVVQETDGGAAVYAAAEKAAEKTMFADQQRAANDAVAAAPSHYAFANDQYLRVTYGSTPEAPSARILGSVDSLADFLARFPEDDLRELAAAYDEDYFRTGRILAVVLEEGSGSVRHTIAHQGVEWGTVTILRQVPEAGTCDMTAWLILAEMDTRFEDGYTFTVLFE